MLKVGRARRGPSGRVGVPPARVRTAPPGRACRQPDGRGRRRLRGIPDPAVPPDRTRTTCTPTRTYATPWLRWWPGHQTAPGRVGAARDAKYKQCCRPVTNSSPPGIPADDRRGRIVVCEPVDLEVGSLPAVREAAVSRRARMWPQWRFATIGSDHAAQRPGQGRTIGLCSAGWALGGRRPSALPGIRRQPLAVVEADVVPAGTSHGAISRPTLNGAGAAGASSLSVLSLLSVPNPQHGRSPPARDLRFFPSVPADRSLCGRLVLGGCRAGRDHVVVGVPHSGRWCRPVAPWDPPCRKRCDERVRGGAGLSTISADARTSTTDGVSSKPAGRYCGDRAPTEVGNPRPPAWRVRSF
jgi:hypothetical protein